LKEPSFNDGLTSNLSYLLKYHGTWDITIMSLQVQYFIFPCILGGNHEVEGTHNFITVTATAKCIMIQVTFVTKLVAKFIDSYVFQRMCFSFHLHYIHCKIAIVLK
jgi:hypothetical protein